MRRTLSNAHIRSTLILTIPWFYYRGKMEYQNLTKISDVIRSSIRVKEEILTQPVLLDTIAKTAEIMIKALNEEKKILFCGNGGSAADAQHLAAELSGRFYMDRRPLPAEALHVNSSYLTAIANDYSYDVVFSRLVEGMGQSGDVLIGLSTSGNSKNILNAMLAAKQKNMIAVGMTGTTGGKMKDVCDYLINVPSNDTPRIQESHIMIGHILCEIIENTMFKK